MQQRIQVGAQNLIHGPAPGVHGRTDRPALDGLGAGPALLRPAARTGSVTLDSGRHYRQPTTWAVAPADGPTRPDRHEGQLRGGKPASPTRCWTIPSTPTANSSSHPSCRFRSHNEQTSHSSWSKAWPRPSSCHNAEGATIPVFDGLGLQVAPGELRRAGPESPAPGQVHPDAFHLRQTTCRAEAAVRVLHDGGLRSTSLRGPRLTTSWTIRRRTLGYVSQFLRVIPPDLDPAAGHGGRCWRMASIRRRPRARRRASARRPAPAQGALGAARPPPFSGGEQQRVNIAPELHTQLPCAAVGRNPPPSLDGRKNRAHRGPAHQAGRSGNGRGP